MSKLFIPSTFLLLIGAIIYLLVDRGVEPDFQNPDSKQSPTADLQLPTSNSTRTAVPHLVRQLIDPSKHLEEQIEAIRALPTDLTSGEFAALFDLLYQSSPSGQRPETWTTLQNELMIVLRRPAYTAHPYLSEISKLMIDRHADPVMRDYAAQHLSVYLSSTPDLSSAQADEGVTAFLTLFSSERESFEEVTGTALMALTDLHARKPELLQEHLPAITKVILPLIDHSRSASLSNQISALQAAGRMRLSEAHPHLRRLAAEPGKLRLSAIASLGSFADPTDRDFLTDLAQGQSKYRFAAQTALKNLQN